MHITKHGMVQLTALVKPELKKEYKKICKELGHNPSALIRNYIEKFVKEHNERKE